MKKQFFNPAMARFVSPITGKSYRANRSLRFGSGAFKTDTPDDDDDDEDEKKELLKRVRKTVIGELESRGVKEEVITSYNDMLEVWKKFPVEALRSIADDKTGVLALIKEQGIRIEGLETRNGKDEDKPLSIRQQLKKYVESNKETLQAIRDGKQVPLPALDLNLRAATSPMLPANTLNGNAYVPAAQIEAGLNDIPSFALTFWDYIVKGRSSSPVYVWVNKTNRQGAAGFIGPGVAKPGISFEIDTDISNAKKVAAKDKVALELLEDIDGFESWVKDELRYQVKLAVNTALMTNAGSSTEPTGIQNLSVAFTATGIVTDNPTFVDAIRAVIAQMRDGKLGGQITVFINPIDAANMDMAKATTSGVYMLPPFVTANGRTIAGATIVEDHNIPVGHFQAAFLQYYVIKIYKDMYITFGWENDDFTKNLLTYLCEMRLHQLFNEIYTGAFVYDTYANVQAAIAA